MEILLMNAGGRNSGRAKERKEKISEIIRDKVPDVVLFQEFTWKRLQGKDFTIPKKYELVGHHEAKTCIMYNKDTVEVTDIPATLTDNFTQPRRMCIRIIWNKKYKKLDFICVSWHGKYIGVTCEERKYQFKVLLDFVLEIGDKYDIPILIGGDFNISMEKVSEIVKDTKALEICSYTASPRRSCRVIDFFIKSKSEVFQALGTKYVDLEIEDAEELFDHDPIICTLQYEIELGFFQTLKERVFQIDTDIEHSMYGFVGAGRWSLLSCTKYQWRLIFNLSDLHIEKIKKGPLKYVIIRMVDQNNNPIYVGSIYNWRNIYPWSDLENGRKGAIIGLLKTGCDLLGFEFGMC